MRTAPGPSVGRQHYRDDDAGEAGDDHGEGYRCRDHHRQPGRAGPEKHADRCRQRNAEAVDQAEPTPSCVATRRQWRRWTSYNAKPRTVTASAPSIRCCRTDR